MGKILTQGKYKCILNGRALAAIYKAEFLGQDMAIQITLAEPTISPGWPPECWDYSMNH